MDTVLITVTLISLALAAAMGLTLGKLLRDERRRSDARVAALLELAAQPPAGAEVPEPVLAFVPRQKDGRAEQQSDGRTEGRKDGSAAGWTEAVTERREDWNDVGEIDIQPESAPAVSELFAEPERSSPWGRRVAIAAGLLIGGTALIVLGQNSAEAPGASTTPRPTAEVQPATAQPLELVSLRHAQEGDTLMISGLVKNPRSGTRLTRISATAVLFDAEGAIVASGRAPLDYTSLAAGDESPFVVTVPISGAVARYRVGFRAEDGSVVAHVDRRSVDVNRAGL